MLLQTSTTIDWNKLFTLAMTLIPVITFIAGFFLSEYIKGKDEKKITDNIKSGLFIEFCMTAIMLNFLKKQFKTDVEGQKWICDHVDSITIDLMNQFIEKISLFKKDEIEPLLFAYQSIRRLKSSAKEHLQFINMEQIEVKGEGRLLPEILQKFKEDTQTFFSSIDITLDSVNAALKQLSKGRKDIREHLERLHFKFTEPEEPGMS